MIYLWVEGKGFFEPMGSNVWMVVSWNSYLNPWMFQGVLGQKGVFKSPHMEFSQGQSTKV